MKNRVYSHILWQSEFIVHFPSLFFNFERSNLFEIQFVTRPLCLDVFSKEVYLVPLPKLRRLLVPLVIVHGRSISNELDVQAQLSV